MINSIRALWERRRVARHRRYLARTVRAGDRIYVPAFRWDQDDLVEADVVSTDGEGQMAVSIAHEKPVETVQDQPGYWPYGIILDVSEGRVPAQRLTVPLAMTYCTWDSRGYRVAVPAGTGAQL